MPKIWWLVEHSWVIVVVFDWSVTGSSATSEGTSYESQARVLGHLDLTMKLNHEPAARGNLDCDGILDRHYTAGAWETKHFKITIEQGIFRSPMRAGGEVEDLRRAKGREPCASGKSRDWDWAHWFVQENEAPAKQWRYAYRLVFDGPPYPPEDDWFRPVHPRHNSIDPETKVEFVAQRLPKSEHGKPAMNAAGQREMVRMWEERPLSEPLLQLAMRLQESERRAKEWRADRERIKAQRQA